MYLQLHRQEGLQWRCTNKYRLRIFGAAQVIAYIGTHAWQAHKQKDVMGDYTVVSRAEGHLATADA